MEQDGAPVAFSFEDGAYIATLNAAPFAFVLPDPLPDVFGVTFGREDLFGLLDLPAEAGLFGPGSGYAREEGLLAAHFMTDPICATEGLGPGHNYLDPERRTGNAYPVAAIHVDAASRRCNDPDRLPMETNLIGVIAPIYVVVRVDDVMERLILRFVSG
ncbi:hypothetical protein [Gymnodinialimonas hymeniacidonis]|uniref:hypothetical protein n=1 Tax=Gymnodinialimonas hymeniacidonis TaxID=3126508 RepID=UPI0034C5BB0D